MNVITFDVIMRDDGVVYISVSQFGSLYKKYLYDGELGNITHEPNWLRLDRLPEKIEKVIPARNSLVSYELKENITPSTLMPQFLYPDNWDDDDDESPFTNYEMKKQYEFIYDRIMEVVPEKYEEIKFAFNTIASRGTNWKFEKVPPNVSHHILTKIENHPMLLQDTSCFYTPKEFYKIIREAIKERIDSRYAKITSDYDFCLTVKKVLNLPNPEEYTVNTNAGTKRKPKMVTHYKRSYERVVYEIAHRTMDQNYPVLKAIEGENLIDLRDKVNNYIDKIIAEINEPLEFCSCCNGTGIQPISESNK